MKKEDLKKGIVYEVASTNFNAALWTGETFLGPAIVHGKYKFVEENHYDDGLPLGVCSPIRELSSQQMKAPYDSANLLILFRSLSDVLYLLEGT